MRNGYTLTRPSLTSRRDISRGKKRSKLLQEIDQRSNLEPDEVPDSSRYLLEIDFASLANSFLERQSYWILAIKAAAKAAWAKVVPTLQPEAAPLEMKALYGASRRPNRLKFGPETTHVILRRRRVASMA